MLYRLDELRVSLRGGEHFVAASASVIGSVILEDRVSIWFNAVLRGDSDLIHIREDSNVQDGAVLHTDPGIPLSVGRGVTIGHMAMLHGCTVGDNSLIGIKAVILNHARIGNNCLIGANTLISEHKTIPDNSLVMGCPGKVIRQLPPGQTDQLREAAQGYVEKMRRYRRALQPLTVAGKGDG